MALKPSTVVSKSASNTTSGTLSATLANDGTNYWYVSGFSITIGGATAGSVIAATLAGVQGGTITYNLAVPTGVTNGLSLSREFSSPLAGAAQATDITLSLAAVGAGSTAAAIVLHGFKGDRQLQ